MAVVKPYATIQMVRDLLNVSTTEVSDGMITTFLGYGDEEIDRYTGKDGTGWDNTDALFKIVQKASAIKAALLVAIRLPKQDPKRIALPREELAGLEESLKNIGRPHVWFGKVGGWARSRQDSHKE